MLQRKNILYVGGLEESVTEEILLSAFIPFGEIKSIQIPKEYNLNRHKGFGFLEYELEEDAADALDNMDGSELYGRVIRCNYAKAIPKISHGQAIWSSEEWIQNNILSSEEQIIKEKNINLENVTLLPPTDMAVE